jgi:hypothetical protein
LASEVEICNSALAKLGVEPISSLSEQSKAARLCQKQYYLIRDELLAHHYWNFAMKREELAALPGEPAFEWSYQYQKPTDCLRVLHLDRPERIFKVEGGKILTKIASTHLLYISKETLTGLYSPHFVEAFAYRLAADLAYPLVQSVSLSERLHAKADQRLADARSLDGQEGVIDELEADVWIGSRFGGDPGTGRF